MPKLTKTYIDKAQAPASNYAMHWDDSVKGYGLRVTAKGKKVFVAMGRVSGKAVCYTLGPYGELTEYEAREKARKVLQAMRDGIDPREVKKQQEEARRLEEIAQVTLREVADAYMGRPGKLKDSSKKEIERHVSVTFKEWEHKPITSITEDMCRQRYGEILTKGTTGKGTGSPAQGNQSFSVLRALIHYAGRRYKKADGTPLIINNPVGALKDDWQELMPRNTRIPESKIGAVWYALEQWRETAYTRDALASIDLIMFLILTGARSGEAMPLTWDRVNLEEGWFHLPDTKNKNPVWMPLSTQAVELLETRQRVKGSPFVFTTWSKSGHITSPRDMMKKVSAIAGLHLTPHDLRRTFTTFGVAKCGIDPLKIELLTNHVPKGVTAKHYLETNHLQYLKPEVQRMADWITGEAKIAEAMAKGDNVVALRA
ncbi:integrase [Ectothiorhodospira shaposhnikovii]|uniref:tyrosine-type recombinase/integrase n=1 Tax=Ectothiorhodospira shaposhnikovii TaxID=1054 RepID=UPI001904964F|nr:integrase arm-type DNA-binding domain-containing protein [Ectothiorhodospira shaposhnikovii]MBK1674173.1 integrase [Ectothiorhodospira shaposhnikovii]